MKHFLRFLLFVILLGTIVTGKSAMREFKFNDIPKFNFDQNDLESETGLLIMQNQKFNSFELNQTNKFSMLPPGDELGAGIMSGFVSLALPGVGLYMANKKLYSLALLPICYGMVGGGIALMMKGAKSAGDNYDLYLAEKNPTLQTEYLGLADDALFVIARGKSILIGGIAIWGLQTAWTFIYGRYNDFYRARNAKWKNQEASFNPGYDFKTKTTSLNLSIKF